MNSYFQVLVKDLVEEGPDFVGVHFIDFIVFNPYGVYFFDTFSEGT